MKRSRLNLFRATSMTISILGVIMIIATAGIFIYIGIEALSSGVTSNVDTSSAYDELATLKSEYSGLKLQFDGLKREVATSSNDDLKQKYVDTELQLVKAQSAISDLESALSTKKEPEEIENRLNIAKKELQAAKTAVSNFRALL
ncbi:MAG: hypothetical protein Kow0019_19790 [Methanobacteriaceae archaeon]